MSEELSYFILSETIKMPEFAQMVENAEFQ